MLHFTCFVFFSLDLILLIFESLCSTLIFQYCNFLVDSKQMPELWVVQLLSTACPGIGFAMG